jgi:hypothetical protein
LLSASWSARALSLWASQFVSTLLYGIASRIDPAQVLRDG